jgi:tetratricopeptide (TPR) repeat protein
MNSLFALLSVLAFSCLQVGCATYDGLSSNAITKPAAGIDSSLSAFEKADQVYRQNDWPQAQILYEDLSRRFPRNSSVWFRLGNALARQGSYEPAVQSYNNTLALEPKHVMAAYNVGLIRFTQADIAFKMAENKSQDQSAFKKQLQQLRLLTRQLLDKALAENKSIDDASAKPELKP